VHSLTLTDIHSGWTECAALVIREQTLAVEGISLIRHQLPFALRGLDTDNDSAFMNETLQSYWSCLLYTSPSPRDLSTSRMPSSA